jgi:hypothetical protein
MTLHSTTCGTIIAVRDYGTVVLVLLEQDNRVIPVAFEHRQFQSLLASEACSTDDLVGRRARYDGESLRLVQVQ